MSIKKFWWRVVEGVVSHDEGEHFDGDNWFFNCEGRTEPVDDDDAYYVQHVDDLFETEEEANASAMEYLESESDELERKKAELDSKIKNTILKLKGLKLKD